MKLFLSVILMMLLSACGSKDPIYGSNPMLDRSSSEIEAIQSLRDSDDPQSALVAAWGNSLEDRIRADFINRNKPLSEQAKIQLLQKKEAGMLTLETKDSTKLEGMVQKGEVLVRVSNDANGNNGIYALACMNGMVNKYDPNQYHDRGYARNYPFSFTVQAGNGFTQVLTNDEAVQAAKDLDKKVIRTKLNEAVVIVPPGFCLAKESPSEKWKQCNN